MLARGSRRRLQQDASRALRPSLEQLQLPWLCPAFFDRPRQQQSLRQSATVMSRASSPASGRAPTPHSSINAPPSKSITARGFATPAAVEHADEYIPFETQSTSTSELPNLHPWNTHEKLSELLPIDPSKTFKLPEEMVSSDRNFRIKDGIGGSISDIHSILQAYLDVGQLEQASMTIRRLHDIYNISEPQLQMAHLAYIATVVSNIIITGDPDLGRHLWRWFNEDVRAKGVVVNPTMIRLLIQATLKEPNPRKMDRQLRRYLHAAKRENVLDESVEELSRFLSEEDFHTVREASPDHFTSFKGVPLASSHESLQTADATPEVLPQQQRGLGLLALRKSLSIFSEPTPRPIRSAFNAEAALAYRQERLEKDTISSSIERWRADHEETVRRTGTHSGLQNKYMGSLMWKWHERLVPMIKMEIQKIRKLGNQKLSKKDAERVAYGPFLQYIAPEKLSAIAILTLLQSLTKTGVVKGIPMARLITDIGRAVENESCAEILKARNKQWITQNMPASQRQRMLAYNNRLEKKLGKKKRPGVDSPLTRSDTPEWSEVIKGNVGMALTFMLMRGARIEVTVPDQSSSAKKTEFQRAITNSTEYIDGKRVGLVRLHERLISVLSKEPVGSAIAKHLPMLTKPMPWTGYREGGYMSQPVSVVRLAGVYVQSKDYIKLASASGDMKQVFAALDILGRTPWKINKAVFDVMLQAWNSGEPVANFAPKNPQLEYPPEPADKTDVAARRLYNFQCKQIDNQRDGMHSNRCFQNFQLEVARAFLNETFYFPHNMDFRGRAYPIPPYLNHMGADNCRGLLMFGKAKPLGEQGLMWLRVHLANVFGFDKASIVERRDFATEHLDDIYDSVTNPLNGRRWWLNAEDPWQCLAACIELKNALESPDPTKYMSHLPIHQDGTCNGLQHYAALGGDAIGAKQVNLEPGDRPADIYSAVANSVAIKVHHDAEAGDELAKALDGKITRKVVKQTVMTNVYGVTYAGARLQVKARLDELYPDLFKNATHGSTYAAGYVAKKTFEALSAMFNGAHDIQYWLGECASRICESLSPAQIQYLEDEAAGTALPDKRFKKRPTNYRAMATETTRFKASVIWTTPLRMPVVQPYRKSKTKNIKTHLQAISLQEPSVSDAVSKRKQLQAFPPNFIHSLDATHMFLSALRCNELGLSFAAVHDSFWTHAGDIDTMNNVLRDAFIRMHSEDIIGRLSAEFEARYSDFMYLASVKKDSAVGKKILALRAENKKKRGRVSAATVQIDELLTEKRRQQLLASEDPLERAEGEAIVTPASLYDEVATEDGEDLEILDALAGAIGEIKPGYPASSDASEEEVDESVVGEEDVHGHLPSTETTAREADSTNAAKTAKNQRKVQFWKKMSFPSLPKKGDFDVTRLKDSKYFFS